MKNVLVADDKATGRELIRTVLEQSGHSVFEASVSSRQSCREVPISVAGRPDIFRANTPHTDF